MGGIETVRESVIVAVGVAEEVDVGTGEKVELFTGVKTGVCVRVD